MPGRGLSSSKFADRALVVALLLFVTVMLIAWAIGVMTGWPGDYSDTILEPGTTIEVTGAQATVVCPADWTCRVVDYVPLPRWSKLGLGAELGLRQVVFLTSNELGDRKAMVIASYHEGTTWQELLLESQSDAPPLNLSGTVFGGSAALGFDTGVDGEPAAAVYVPLIGSRGGTAFIFSGAESNAVDATDLINGIAASVQLRFEE